MSVEHKKIRYLIPPGTQFDFLSRSRLASVISLIVLLASIGALFFNLHVRGAVLNWTIDFQGGTEVIFAARNTETKEPALLAVGAVRETLERAGYPSVEVSSLEWTEDDARGVAQGVEGIVVRTTRFGAVTPAQAVSVEAAVRERFAERGVLFARWTSDTLVLRSEQPIAPDELAPIFAAAGLEMKPVDRSVDEPAAFEYRLEVTAAGVERELERLLQRSYPGVDIQVVQSYAVGPRASEDLFFTALEAIAYAMGLIMLYLVFRFDIRYAPGALKATVHDTLIVIGVLAVTWTPVSLPTLAALLTVIGYSVNDTAIVFDRIRENVRIHTNQDIEKIVNLSLNEVLGRSLLTSLFVLSVTLMMTIFGDGVLASFAFVLNVGVVVGAASTIFLSAPVFVAISKRWYSRPPRRHRSVPAHDEA